MKLTLYKLLMKSGKPYRIKLRSVVKMAVKMFAMLHGFHKRNTVYNFVIVVSFVI